MLPKCFRSLVLARSSATSNVVSTEYFVVKGVYDLLPEQHHTLEQEYGIWGCENRIALFGWFLLAWSKISSIGS